MATLPPISQGAVSDTPETIIKKHLSTGLTGPGWDALIAAIAAGDNYLSDLAAKAFRQLFKSTAGGKYLDKKVSDDGFVRPPGVGISDDVFRKLAIKIGAEKLTLQSFLQVLETYYGSEAVRASIDTDIIVSGSTQNTFALVDGDDLIIEADGKQVTIVFKEEHFTHISQARPEEIASVITRSFQIAKIQAYAIPVLNPSTNQTIIRIYSGALGLRGALRVLGGRAQLALNFPTAISTTQAIGTQWTISTPATISGLISNRARISWIGGTNPSLQLVRIGDYISIYGTPFNSNNRGSYIIVDVTTTYVEIVNSNATGQIGVAQLAANDVKFYRPTRFTINSKPRISLAAQGSTKESDVILAATTQAVGRDINSAAYLHDNTEINLLNKVSVDSMSSSGVTVTVNTTTAHGLAVGDTFFLAPGDPDISKQFTNGVKTVVSTPTATQLTYSETGLATTATLPQTIYPCYRNSSGVVTIKCSTPHGFSTNDHITLTNLLADTKVAPPVHAIAASTGFNAAWYLSWQAGVKLLNGKILQCGGDSAGVFKNTTILYDYTTNSWSAAANMNVARSRHTATLLNNGRVLVTGGNISAPVATCEIYDPDTNVWITASPMANARYGHTATLLSDGRVLVVGGGTTTVEIFNPNTGLWTTVASIPANRFHHQAVRLQDNRVLVCGGYAVSPTAQSGSWVYNPYNDYWTTAGNMPTAVFHHRAILTTQTGVSGKVISSGGVDNVTVNGTIAIFDPQTLTWTAGPTGTAKYSHAMVELSNGKIMLQGGMIDAIATHSIDSLDYYDPIDNTIKTLVYTGSVGRATHIAFEVANQKVLFGPSDTHTSDTPELFDPQTGTYASGGLNGTFTATVLDSRRFTYRTTDDTLFTKTTPIVTSYVDMENKAVLASAKLEKAVIDNNHIGPYILDPNNGPAITAISTTLGQDIAAHNHYSTITVASTANFPDSEGYLVFAFGKDNQTFPVRYLNVISSTVLLIDSSFKFPYDLPSGTNLILLENRGALELDDPEETGLFYLTDSVAGRVAASKTIDSIAAAGAHINKTITYPGDVGLGNEGEPVTGAKVSDKVWIWGTEQEVNDAHEE
jgi:hypothetical protein